MGNPHFVLFLFASIFCGMFIAGVVLLPLGLPKYIESQTLDVATDFPPMSAETCTVTKIWNRPTIREESCGQYCTQDVCYDDFIAEFAWNGDPTHAAPTITNPADTLISRTDNSCKHSDCSKSNYGGWAEYASVDASSFTNAAVSQGWKIRRCESCQCEGDPVDPASDTNGRTTGIAAGAVLTCRVPAGAVADVSSIYACPGQQGSSNGYDSASATPYNTICARLGDLPQIEIDEGAASSLVLLILGAVFIPCGLSLAIISVLCAFKALKQYKARSAPPKMAGGVA